ncbi:hypothetical protein J3R30DRAFT_3427091 [Lentinula aciculospora]|uniref:RING-CH-type domain-containing protein n=1 Tax=Lentinula aciculospora TaxID=153920 RepID=A0A9W9DXL3_9AGAR|nr:hypothetical protein J3R30DRAFT_3427091 [Lentinula aciculospora]
MSNLHIPVRRRTSLLNDISDRKTPTIDDLRVKECYICRDEERYDDPAHNRREWVHPCKCKLIAHQSCLLNSIARRPANRAKCPQCGFEYQIQSNLPFLISSLFFRVGDTIFHAMGMSCLATSVVGMATFTAVSVFAVGTGYGAIAVREYFGPGLYDLLLTDEPTNWHAGHFFFLFLIPLRLVSPFMNLGTFTPFFFLWPSVPPRSVQEQLIAESNRIDGVFPISSQKKQFWPPSLQTFGFIAIGTSMLYNRVFARFSEWVLGMKQPKPHSLFRGLTFRREFRRQEGPDGAEQEAVLQLQREAPEEPDTPFANLDGVTQYPNISIMIGLLKPFIASGMGHLLYFGAQHSNTLRFVLGVRDLGNIAALYTSPKLVPELSDNVWYWRYFTETVVQEMDPVWIRNSVGLGLFIVAKDCIHLFHLWLTKRELASRRLKNHDFAGIDLEELDLIHPVSTSL